MQKISINIEPAHETSQLFIGKNVLEQISTLIDLRAYSKIFVLTDEIVGPLLLNKLLQALPADTAHFIVPPGERDKHIGTVQSIWTAMHRAGCDRKTLVINLGGGVMGDMGGFAASTYMRGVDFVQIPTTLQAQVDASVGGKTGIDFDGIKNLIGAFDQPRAVIIDPTTLKTLPKRDFIAAFAEIIKHGLIVDQNYLERVIAKPPLDFTTEELEDIIAGSCRIKADVVRRDAKEESGHRKIVNFGHTVGHAIEALSLETEKPLLHGEAIAMGMVVEAELSHRQGLLSARDANLVKQYLKTAGLPVIVPKLPLDQLLEIMRSDKKNLGNAVRFTLLESIGHATIDQEVAPEVVKEVIKQQMVQGTDE